MVQDKIQHTKINFELTLIYPLHFEDFSVENINLESIRFIIIQLAKMKKSIPDMSLSLNL